MTIGSVFSCFLRQQVDSSAAEPTQSGPPSKLGALGQKLKNFFPSSSNQSSPRATNFNDLPLNIRGLIAAKSKSGQTVKDGFFRSERMQTLFGLKPKHPCSDILKSFNAKIENMGSLNNPNPRAVKLNQILSRVENPNIENINNQNQ